MWQVFGKIVRAATRKKGGDHHNQVHNGNNIGDGAHWSFFYDTIKVALHDASASVSKEESENENYWMRKNYNEMFLLEAIWKR